MPDARGRPQPHPNRSPRDETDVDMPLDDDVTETVEQPAAGPDDGHGSTAWFARRVREPIRGWNSQTRTLRDDRLTPGLTPERRKRYLIGAILAGLLGLWLPPSHGSDIRFKLLGALVAVVAFALGAMIVERERRHHAEHADRHDVMLPDGVSRADGYYILPVIIKTDKEIIAVARRHLVTIVPRVLMVTGLMLGAFGFMWFPVNLKTKFVVFAVCLIVSRYLIISWRRRFLFLTEDRLIDLEDLPVPFDDKTKAYPLQYITELDTDKPMRAQLLPGTSIAVRITMSVYGNQVKTPFIANGEVFYRLVQEAQARKLGSE